MIAPLAKLKIESTCGGHLVGTNTGFGNFISTYSKVAGTESGLAEAVFVSVGVALSVVSAALDWENDNEIANKTNSKELENLTIKPPVKNVDKLLF